MENDSLVDGYFFIGIPGVDLRVLDLFVGGLSDHHVAGEMFKLFIQNLFFHLVRLLPGVIAL